jgi:hypothetical protein
MDVAGIAKVAFTSEDRVRDVIQTFSADGFGSLYPKYKGGRLPKFILGQRRLNRVEAQFTALRHVALDGTDHACDQRLRQVVTRANVA